MAGLPVDLASVGEPWADAETHPEIPDSQSFTVVTDAAGRFDFDVPLPSSSWVTFSFHPPPFLQRDGRDFGFAGGRRRAPLHPGDNDLGTLRLLDAGAVEGHVRDAAGVPTARAAVTAELSNTNGYTVMCFTGDDGHYELGGVPPGRLTLSAEAKGLVEATLDGIVVRAAETTLGCDFMLAAKPQVATISGRVTDDNGAPVSGVDIEAWPMLGGRGAFATSADDGRFELTPSENVPFRVGIDAVGFERLASPGPITPGTHDVELVLQRAPVVRLRVVDAVTGAPLERCGAAAGWDEDLELADHPGGLLEVRMRSREESPKVIAAGHAPRSDVQLVATDSGQAGEITPDADGTYIVALQPETIVVGRTLLGGVPQPQPALSIAAQPLPVPKDAPDYDPVFRATTTDVDSLAGAERRLWGDGDGRFRIGGLQAGHWRLVLSAAGSAERTLDFVVDRAGELDLGNLELPRGGTIDGRVVLRAGASPAGLRVGLDTGSRVDADDGDVHVLDGGGAFQFERVTAGQHQLFVGAVAGLVRAGAGWPVDVAEGETSALTLDLAPRAPHTIEVSVRVNGAPAAGLQVVLTRTAPPEPGPEPDGFFTTDEHGNSWKALGVTDEGGGLLAETDGSGSVRLVVVGGGCSTLAAIETVLLPGESTRQTVDVVTGRLHVRLRREDMAGAASLLALRVARVGEEPSFGQAVMPPALAPDLWDLGPLLPGRYRVVTIGRGGWISTEVEVQAGQTVEALLAAPAGG